MRFVIIHIGIGVQRACAGAVGAPSRSASASRRPAPSAAAQGGAARAADVGGGRQRPRRLLGRKVELLAYDDQSNPATTPGI